MPGSGDEGRLGRGGGRRGSFSGRGKQSPRGNKRRNTNEHFYQGGCKTDPLNLKNVGSGDEMDTTVEKYEEPPIPQEMLEVKIPRNINPRDPLNLQKVEKAWKRKNSERANADGEGLLSPTSKKSKSGGSEPSTPKKGLEAQEKKKNKKEYFNNRYSYGNFDRYYGTRLGPDQKDDRLKVLTKEWFERKSVLDIGCNVGFLTLSIAKEYNPRRILGIDIDEHLVGVARKNIRHYCDKDMEFAGKFPASFSNQFGPISTQSISFSTKFPDNIWFRKENYVLDSDELLELVEEEFDVILALSITKWIHLNFGDEGLRRFFKRAFRQLHPGGRFILEPQPFASYKKRAKMTEALKKNFETIEFKPDNFEMYLIDEVGFERVEHLGAPSAKSKGFERPVDVYVKRPPKFMEKHAKPSKKTAPSTSADDTKTSSDDGKAEAT